MACTEYTTVYPGPGGSQTSKVVVTTSGTETITTTVPCITGAPVTVTMAHYTYTYQPGESVPTEATYETPVPGPEAPTVTVPGSNPEGTPGPGPAAETPTVFGSVPASETPVAPGPAPTSPGSAPGSPGSPSVVPGSPWSSTSSTYSPTVADESVSALEGKASRSGTSILIAALILGIMT
ncbi:hypothetical protein QA089_005422 [Meyerozyma guilliermondii]